jgi:MFS transporter, FSR family, fosmidomycin resistance protein
MASAWGMQTAIIAAGVLGLVVAAPLLPARWMDRAAAARTPAGALDIPLKRLLTPAVISLIGFFTLLSLSSGALTNYSAVALTDLYGMTLSAANVALSSFLFATAVGVLAGGFIADATKRHGDVAGFGFGASAVLILVVGSVDLGPILLAVAMGAAGFLSGMISPSRDMLVRAASPPGATGRVFGVVTTGFNIGGALGPVLYGWLMDHGQPRAVFLVAVGFMVLTMLLALERGGRSQRRTQQPAPAE